MNKTLILTGWSKTVYMTAAAAAIEALSGRPTWPVCRWMRWWVP